MITPPNVILTPAKSFKVILQEHLSAGVIP